LENTACINKIKKKENKDIKKIKKKVNNKTFIDISFLKNDKMLVDNNYY